MGNLYIMVGNYNNEGSKTNIDSLINKFKNKDGTFAVLKGTKLHNGKSSIIYILGRGNRCSILENVFRDSSKGNVKITKVNKTRKSHFDFSAWSIMRLGNGQLTGNNMNMLNDNEKYSCYEVI